MRGLIKQSPALRAKDNPFHSSAERASLVIDAASRMSIALDEVTKRTHLNAILPLGTQVEIEDAQLEGVSGGTPYSSRTSVEQNAF